MEVLKVSSKSNPNSVAGALAGVLREKRLCRNTSDWCRSIKSSCKGNSYSERFVAPSGMDLVCIPAFTDVAIDGEERTAIKLIVEPR